MPWDLCDVCQNAAPLNQPATPPSWKRWTTQPDSVPWAKDVWLCPDCGNLWHLNFSPHDMLYVEALVFSDKARRLVTAGTAWQEAWALRNLPDPVVPRYLALHLGHADLPWQEAAERITRDLLSEHATATPEAKLDDYRYMRELYYNLFPSRAVVAPETVAELRRRVGSLAPPADAPQSIRAVWSLYLGQAEEAAEIQRNYLRAQANQAAGGFPLATLQAPEVSSKPAEASRRGLAELTPVTDTIANRPAAGELFAAALSHLAGGFWRYVGPALLLMILVEGVAPKVQGDTDVVAIALFALGYFLYSATASVAAGRWDASPWGLFVDRFSDVLRVLATLLLVVPVWLVLLTAMAVFAGDQTATPLAERGLWYAAFLLAGMRLWPMAPMTFVYRGYLYMSSLTIGDSKFEWMGPGIRVAWRLSGQAGFFRRVTLPLWAAIALVLTILEATGWAFGARIAVYVIALPLLAQFADEAVDRWRIESGNERFDR